MYVQAQTLTSLKCLISCSLYIAGINVDVLCIALKCHLFCLPSFLYPPLPCPVHSWEYLSLYCWACLLGYPIQGSELQCSWSLFTSFSSSSKSAASHYRSCVDQRFLTIHFLALWPEPHGPLLLCYRIEEFPFGFLTRCGICVPRSFGALACLKEQSGNLLWLCHTLIQKHVSSTCEKHINVQGEDREQTEALYTGQKPGDGIRRHGPCCDDPAGRSSSISSAL